MVLVACSCAVVTIQKIDIDDFKKVFESNVLGTHVVFLLEIIDTHVQLPLIETSFEIT